WKGAIHRIWTYIRRPAGRSLLLLVIAAPMSAMSFTGQVQTSGAALDVHKAPDVTSAIVGTLQNGSPTTIACQIRGGTVAGNWGITNLWNFIGNGYVSDGFVYTGANSQIAPTCDVQGAIPKADSTNEAQRISKLVES